MKTREPLEHYFFYSWRAVGYTKDGEEIRTKGLARAINREALESQIEWMLFFDFCCEVVLELDITLSRSESRYMLNDGPVVFFEGPSPSWIDDKIVLITTDDGQERRLEVDWSGAEDDDDEDSDTWVFENDDFERRSLLYNKPKSNMVIDFSTE